MAKSKESFASKDRIAHGTYGLGTVSEVNPKVTTIVFDDAGTRRFLTEKVQMERSDAPPPVKVSRARKTKVVSKKKTKVKAAASETK